MLKFKVVKQAEKKNIPIGMSSELSHHDDIIHLQLKITWKLSNLNYN